jgi:hypothetical protein
VKRRDLLLVMVSASIAAAWSRVVGAVGTARDTSPHAVRPRQLWAGDIFDRMYSDMHRRSIDHPAFNRAWRAGLEVLHAGNRGEIDDDTATARMSAIRSEAPRHPPPPRQIPPLPADQVGVHEAMALLRRAICGESHIALERPWKEVIYCHGAFEIDGWRMTAFKRSRGIKHLDRAVA